MNSKISFFNKDVFLADIKRFWWVSVSYLFLFLISGIFVLVSRQSFDGYYFMSAMAGIIGIVFPVILLSYLNHSGSVTFIHAFPIKRKEHYFTHLIFAFLSIAVPTLFCYIIGITKLGYLNDEDSYIQMYLIHNMLIIMGLSCGTLGCMLSGNAISSLVFSGLIAGFPFYTEAIARGFIEMNVYGINGLLSNVWFENFRLGKLSIYTSTLFILAIAILYISLLMYKKRALEKNGDILVFEILKPIFIALTAILAGFSGYFYVCDLFNVKNVFIMLPFAFVGIIISNMLSKRAFTLKGIIMPCIYYTLGIALLFSVFKFDLFCYERHLPNVEDVQTVTLASDNESKTTFWLEDGKYVYSDPLKPEELEFTSKEDIQNVINLHKFCFENKLTAGDSYYPINYTLKNGKKLKRYYPVNYKQYEDLLKPVLETPQMRMEKYQFTRDYEYSITGITIRDFRTKSNSEKAEGELSKSITDESKINSLITALKKDIENAPYDVIYKYNSTATMIDIEMERPVISIDDNRKKSHLADCITVGVPYSFTNTIGWLNNNGFYDGIITSDYVYSINIVMSGTSNIDITDKEEINAMYEYLCYNKRSTIIEKYLTLIGSAYTTYKFNDINGKLLFTAPK